MEQEWDEDDWGLEEEEDYSVKELKRMESAVFAFDDQQVFQAKHRMNRHYTAYEQDEIHVAMKERITEVAENTGISMDLASALLMKNQWHTHRAIDSLLKDNFLMT